LGYPQLSHRVSAAHPVVVRRSCTPLSTVLVDRGDNPCVASPRCGSECHMPELEMAQGEGLGGRS